MAEFCYKCFCDFWGEAPNRKKLIFSDDPDLCEGCGQYEKTVIAYKRDYYAYKYRHLIIAAKSFAVIILLPFILITLLVQKTRKKTKKR